MCSLPWLWISNIQFCEIPVLYNTGLYFPHRHIRFGDISAFTQPLHSLWAFSNCPPLLNNYVGYLQTWVGRGLIFNSYYVFVLSLLTGFLTKAGILRWSQLPLLSITGFITTLCTVPHLSWVALHNIAYKLHWLDLFCTMTRDCDPAKSCLLIRGLLC